MMNEYILSDERGRQFAINERQRFLEEQSLSEIKGTRVEIGEKAEKFFFDSLTAKNPGISEDQFYNDNNIVDFTDVSTDDMREVNDGIMEFSKINGCYAALPPFEKGSFIDRSERRFSVWQVLQVTDDYYDIKFDHYPIYHFRNGVTGEDEMRACWVKAASVTVRVKKLSYEERVDIVLSNPWYDRLASEVAKRGEKNKLEFSAYIKDTIEQMPLEIGGVLLSSESFLPAIYKKIGKSKMITPEGSIINASEVRAIIDQSSQMTDYAMQTMIFTSLGPVIEAFTYVNYVLSAKKNTGEKLSSYKHISKEYVLPGDSEREEVRRERHFGKIRFVSGPKPEAVTKENAHIVYKTLSWQRRSHLRHLQNGKVVSVKEAVCKRKLLDQEDPQQGPAKVIYKA